ncbi:MAG: hypothetical protein COA90_11650 [Gammaproteobacteria bacterium]|nr:MAG: hypothetical protein COA90_11650 [Gammaproteobacteria bacterium]
MKNLFPGYFKKTEEESLEIWGDCIFVLDANILLNLYRYSESTKSDVLRILENEKLRNFLWLPNRAAAEYFENRTNVITEQIKSYAETKKLVEKMQKSFDDSNKHPFVSESM